MPRDYVYDQGFSQERTRLAGIESLWDPGRKPCWTTSVSARLEVPGSRRRRRLAAAVDERPRCHGGGRRHRYPFHRTAGRRHDRRPPPRHQDRRASRGEFDLVHSRLVLEHLPDRRQIIDRLAGALRPGGWMVIEDYDWTAFGFEGSGAELDRVTEAILSFMQRSGFEPHYGRQVVADLAAAGLTEVRGEGRARVIDSATPGFDFFRLSFESLRDAVVDAGLISPEDADAAAARFGEDVRVFTPIMMAGIGRR
ncbi:methyltransferase domain protein [Mycobacterium kansasii 824]|nr:methyltransferase domain protein [Mycobacterium kansasii 824]